MEEKKGKAATGARDGRRGRKVRQWRGNNKKHLQIYKTDAHFRAVSHQKMSRDNRTPTCPLWSRQSRVHADAPCDFANPPDAIRKKGVAICRTGVCSRNVFMFFITWFSLFQSLKKPKTEK